MVYEGDAQDEASEDQGNFLENMDDPQFDLEYVAKVLDYKNHLAKTQMVGIISYRNPYDIRYR